MAMMGGGMGLRTIWITLRAVNYTQRIFSEVIRSLQQLEGAEKDFGKAQLQNLRIGNALIMTGMMMATIGQMMYQNMWNLAMATEKGSFEMQALKETMEETQIALADSFYEVLKVTGILDTLKTVLNIIKSNDTLGFIIGLLILLASVALIVGGGIMLLGGTLISLKAIIEILPTVTGVLNLALGKIGITANITALSIMKMSIALSGAFVSFMLIMAITEKFGKAAGIVTGLAIAVIGLALAFSFLKAVITSGASLALDVTSAIGVGLLASGIMGALYAGTKQTGTRSLSQTGLFLGHEGEVVYNPATHRPTQIGNDIEAEGEGGRGGISYYQMPVTIENVHTKAEFDDLEDEFDKAWRKKMRRRR